MYLINIYLTIDSSTKEGKTEVNIAKVGTAPTQPSLRRGGAIINHVQNNKGRVLKDL